MLSTIKLAFRHLDPNTLTILYKAYVLPFLDYCCMVWTPFNVKDIEVLEKVQRRFTRMLPDYRHLPYDFRLRCYKLSSLYARRLFLDLLCVCKIIRGLVDINPSNLFKFNTDLRTRGHRFKILSVSSRLDIRHHWLSSRIVPFWNYLPASCVEFSTVKSFKRHLWLHFSSLEIKQTYPFPFFIRVAPLLVLLSPDQFSSSSSV